MNSKRIKREETLSIKLVRGLVAIIKKQSIRYKGKANSKIIEQYA